MSYQGFVYKTPRPTCKGCNKRYLGCHDHCDDFIQAHKDWEKEKAQIKRNMQQDIQIDRHKSDQVTQQMRRQK